ncbi:MAG: glycoside hydrolase family 2, partial [Prevotella sp.]|nr:glycoside hydrolase family 2 [Prevotella sp.]
GTLLGEALDKNGKVASTYQLQTSGRPYALKARLLNADNDFYQLEVTVVDEQGITVKLADNEIGCGVMGNGRLMGMENSDSRDTSDKSDFRERAHNGRLIVYVKGGSGVRFISPLLAGCSLSFE